MFFVLLLVLAAGCRPPLAPPPAVERAAPEEASHYRSFADVESLSDYLRYGSEAGPLVSAHRGGPAPGYPENALPTFERTLSHAPALLEVDVGRTADGALVLMHDDTLERTTTGTGPLGSATLETVRALRLVGPTGAPTPYRVPTLREALAWSEGRAVLTLDVKDDVRLASVVRAVRRAEAANRVVVIVYTMEDLKRLHALAPELMISASAETPAGADAVLAAVPADRLIAFTGVGTVHSGAIERLHAAGVRAMLGTFGPLDERARRRGPGVYEALLRQGVDVLATDYVRGAAAATRAGREATAAGE